MRARVVRIGNSQGIRIPKPLLQQIGVGDDVDLQVEDNQIVIRPLSNPRAGWDQAFESMAESGDDALVIADEGLAHTWDEDEWQW